MMEVLPFVEDPDHSVSAARATSATLIIGHHDISDKLKLPDTREEMELQSKDKRQRALSQQVPYQENQHVGGASWHSHNNQNDVNRPEASDKS